MPTAKQETSTHWSGLIKEKLNFSVFFPVFILEKAIETVEKLGTFIPYFCPIFYVIYSEKQKHADQFL